MTLNMTVDTESLPDRFLSPVSSIIQRYAALIDC